MGAAISAKPKPKLLREFGIETQTIYRNSFVEKLQPPATYYPDDDYDEEGEGSLEEPLSWSGLVEVNTLFHPTMTAALDIDQKGFLYFVQGTLTLPQGTARLEDEFSFVVSLS